MSGTNLGTITKPTYLSEAMRPHSTDRGLEPLRRAWQVYGPEIMDSGRLDPRNAGHRPAAFWLFDHGLEWLTDTLDLGLTIRWPDGISGRNRTWSTSTSPRSSERRLIEETLAPVDPVLLR